MKKQDRCLLRSIARHLVEQRPETVKEIAKGKDPIAAVESALLRRMVSLLAESLNAGENEEIHAFSKMVIEKEWHRYHPR